MELSATTFILEVINFLVLVWILKHFLYRPVLDVIAKRRDAIAEELDSARRTREEADAVKSQYAGRLTKWETERQSAREALRGELASERERLLADLNAELRQEREKATAITERERSAMRRRDQEWALRLGAAFASRLLGSLAGPQLELSLVSLFATSLARLSVGDRRAITHEWKPGESRIVVTTAYPMDAATQQRLKTSVSESLDLDRPRWRFDVDSELVAGIRVEIGPKVLRASIRDELSLFSELADVVD